MQAAVGQQGGNGMRHPHRPYFDEHADNAEKNYALILHLVGLISMLEWVTSVTSTIVVGIMWAVKKDQSPFLDDHGKEAFNFQLSLLLYAVVGVVLSPIGVGVLILVIGIPVLRLIGCIRGAIAAGRGEYFRYPMCIRFFS